MRILVIADMHGYVDEVSEFFRKIDASGFDLIISPGDFTDMFNQPPGFSQTYIADMMLQKLIAYNTPLLCLPGNHDPYEIIDLFNEYNVNIHGKHKRLKGEDFIGWGGALTPFGTAFEPTEAETKSVLDSLSSKVEGGNFVLILHNPPYGTGADVTASGEHTGSKEIRAFIEKMQPKVVISAHIHEARGESKLGDVKILNPGPFYAGYYGIIEINGKDIKCEIKKVELDV